MKLYPAFLDLNGRACLVVGAGRVGSEKAAGLAAAGARVHLIDPSPCERALALGSSDTGITVERRTFRDGDSAGRLLVFACTNDPEVNEQVLRDAEREGSLCCRADDASRGHFQVPAVLRRGELAVAVSSAGASPALALEARARIEAVVGEEFGEAAGLFGSLRANLKEHADTGGEAPAAIDAALVRSVLAALASGDRQQAEAIVEEAAQSPRRRSNFEARCTR
jgi:precorrin-2 dehydrogenase / sirohydrochlorin ferrochelatase